MKLTILGTGNATVTEYYNTCFGWGRKTFPRRLWRWKPYFKGIKRDKNLVGRCAWYLHYTWACRSYSWNCVDDSFDRNQDESGKLWRWSENLLSFGFGQYNSDTFKTDNTEKSVQTFRWKNFIHSIGARRSAYNSWEKSDFLRYYVNISKTVWIHDEYRWKEIYMCWRWTI